MQQPLVKDIVAALDEEFKLEWQDEWDNSGLLVGDPEMHIKGILTAVDIREQTLTEAVKRNCNLVVSHHPLMLRSVKRLTVNDNEQRLLIDAIKSGIALYASHTPLDKHPSRGTSVRVGHALGITDMSILIDEGGYGYGVVGDLPFPLDTLDFLSKVRECLNANVIRHNGFCKRSIRRVAICTGSSVEYAAVAARLGADAFLTADVKYHQMGMRPDLLLCDAGHYETEVMCKKILTEFISEKFTNFAPCYESQPNDNIVNYYI